MVRGCHWRAGLLAGTVVPLSTTAPHEEATMAEKPSYLGLLNAISVLECRAHEYLTAWADVTPNAEVRSVLQTVAAREGEHGMSFAKRINELGFEVRRSDDAGFAEQLEIARSGRPDLEKFEKLQLLRLCSDDEPDVFDSMFRDHSIDIRTGELLGRYIAEERDSLRRLQGCASALGAAPATSAPASDRLAALEEKVDAVGRAVDDLRQIVCAQTMPSTAT
jgi:rubrerythrin